jgi:hypothetical protein
MGSHDRRGSRTRLNRKVARNHYGPQPLVAATIGPTSFCGLVCQKALLVAFVLCGFLPNRGTSDRLVFLDEVRMATKPKISKARNVDASRSYTAG